MPRNSDSYSLLVLDEHLWKWIDACNNNDYMLSAPDRGDSEALLKRLLSVWPVLLKLLNSASSSQKAPLWMPYVIRAADRLFLAARDIPMKVARSQIDALLDQISDIEARANKLVEIQVEKEKIVFFGNYSSVSSEYHTAVDYWPIWEQQVREEAMRIVKEKLEELQKSVSLKRVDLEKMHLDQLTIRDRWAEMRGRLHPERYEDTTAWWGSIIKPSHGASSEEFLQGIPEFVSMSDAKLESIPVAYLTDTVRGLSRIHLNSTSAIGVKSSVTTEGTAGVPWSILRSTCIDLLKELTLVVERKKVNSPVVFASLNIADILLRLLYSHDTTQFEEEEQALSRLIMQARSEAENYSKLLSNVNPSVDPVVARFAADEKAECVQAAIKQVMSRSRHRNGDKRDERIRNMIELQAKLNMLLAYKQANFEDPWVATWSSWRKIVGDVKAESVEPPPLQYTS